MRMMIVTSLYQPIQNRVGKGVLNMKNRTSTRIRVSRFLSERYVQRERPNYFPELGLFGIIVITAIWAILPLTNALAALR
jgi:hypothetical protein